MSLDALSRQLQTFLSSLLEQATDPVIDGSLAIELGPVVSHASLAAPSAEFLLAQAFAPQRNRLLDFGCGGSHHRGYIESLGYAWTGVDFLEGVAPAVQDSVGKQGDVVFYDGRTLPFEDRSFDIVYSMLVFNCLRHIEDNHRELARVLKPGGLIIGQTGSLEVMTDFISLNPTAFGLKSAASAAGLSLTQIYPKHDVFSFLARQLFIILTRNNETPFTPMLNPEGFFYAQLETRASELGLSIRDINLLKIQFSSHLCFVMEKPA